MSTTEPIVFYELVAKEGGPYFSPYAIRARLAFAFKRVPIRTVDITYQELLHEWRHKLNVPQATVPFIRRPDGTYLMDSFKITEWLDQAFPDLPSPFLPEAPPPVERESEAYVEAGYEGEEFRRWEAAFQPTIKLIASLYCPLIWETFDPATQKHYIQHEEEIGNSWAAMLERDSQETIAQVREDLTRYAAMLGPGQGFFSSPTKPGIKDLWIYGPHRMLSATCSSNLRRTYLDAGLGPWAKRMREYFGQELELVLARDPK